MAGRPDAGHTDRPDLDALIALYTARKAQLCDTRLRRTARVQAGDLAADELRGRRLQLSGERALLCGVARSSASPPR